jgi:hypothetical protein
MKVATWNVNGIRARASQVQEWLERERPDVVCLRQDYHAFCTAARAILECRCNLSDCTTLAFISG